jgi:organic hydroperoxide reductase OsmC/OhrA
MAGDRHLFTSHLTWNDPDGLGTTRAGTYSRQYTIRIDGKADLIGTAAPAFRGDPALPNPEDLFISAIAACHMLTYLAIAAKSGITVLSYRDEASGTLVMGGPDGSRFEEVVLRPEVVVSADSDQALALKIHDSAHRHCFIANSSSTPIRYEATISVAATT